MGYNNNNGSPRYLGQSELRSILQSKSEATFSKCKNELVSSPQRRQVSDEGTNKKLMVRSALWKTKRRMSHSSFTDSSSSHSHSDLMKSSVASKESWMPEKFRSKMLARDLQMTRLNFQSNELCRVTGLKEAVKRHNMTTLDRSLTKEKFGIETRKPCGLCCLDFLPMSLVTLVPFKAILDLRDSWGTKFDPGGITRVRVNPNVRRAPACYDQTRVCRFCSQLFDNPQESYRPTTTTTFKKKVTRNTTFCEHDKHMRKHDEDDTIRNLENDPLAQLDRDLIGELTELAKMTMKHKNSDTKIEVIVHSTMKVPKKGLSFTRTT